MSIAMKHDVLLLDLKRVNKIYGSTVYPGQVLFVPHRPARSVPPRTVGSFDGRIRWHAVGLQPSAAAGTEEGRDEQRHGRRWGVLAGSASEHRAHPSLPTGFVSHIIGWAGAQKVGGAGD